MFGWLSKDMDMKLLTYTHTDTAFYIIKDEENKRITCYLPKIVWRSKIDGKLFSNDEKLWKILKHFLSKQFKSFDIYDSLNAVNNFHLYLIKCTIFIVYNI